MKYLTLAILVLGMMFSSLHAQTATESRIMELTAGNFSNEVELSKGNVIVDIYADWCQPCKKMKPIFDALSSAYPNIKFVKLNSDNAKDIAKRLNVTGLPIFIFFKDGKEVGRLVGFTSEDSFKAKIKEFFK